jgi:valine--pyruvate aminotransferase
MNTRNIHLSHVGAKMSRLTGVRAIMKDIQETLSSKGEAAWLNLSAGNPVILSEIEDMWRRHTRDLTESPQFGEIVWIKPRLRVPDRGGGGLV